MTTIPGPRPLRATNVQFSGAMPGGHGSASFEVAVANAYLQPPKALSEGAWIVLYEDGHELFEGEIFSVRPSVSGGEHKLAVECGGMLAVAGKRRDVSKTWVHRGGEGWKVRPQIAQQGGSYSFESGYIELRAMVGDTTSFTGVNCMQAAFVLDDELSDEEISYVSVTAVWDVLTEGGSTWAWNLYAGSLINGSYTLLDSEVNTSSAGTSYAYTPPAGTKVLVAQLVEGTQHTISADKYIRFTVMDIYSSGRTTKARLDEAMVDLATRPGLALTATSKRVGAAMDDLRIGNGAAKVTAADGIQTLAQMHASEPEWGFGDGRSFDVRPRLWTPKNDSKVIVVGGGNPGLVSWEVAEYDEDVPDYACVIFGNKDSAAYPEGWPRRTYRPTTPPDENCKVKLLDYSGTILSDASAQAIGDYEVGRTAGTIPPDYVFRVHAERADQGIWPGNNEDPTALWQDISDNRAVGTLTGNPQWAGSNSPADPSCLVFDGNDYVTFGDLAQCDLGTGARTVIVWAKIAAAPGVYAELFSKILGSGTYVGWHLYVTAALKLGADLIQNVGATEYRSGVGATTLALDTWYCLGASYAGSGGDWTCYVNGVAETMTAGGAAGAWNADNTVPACLGVADPAGAALWPLTGSENSAVVYPRALSAAEIAAIYAAGPCLYDRSAAKGTVVLQGTCRNRKGAPIPAHHVRAGWWIQNRETGSGRPLYLTGHSVDVAAKRNALTIGQDWMEKEIGVRQAELLAIPAYSETLADTEAAREAEYDAQAAADAAAAAAELRAERADDTFVREDRHGGRAKRAGRRVIPPPDPTDLGITYGSGKPKPKRPPRKRRG